MRAALLLAGDLACFAAFAAMGLNSHNEAFTLANAARAAGTFTVAWVALAALRGLYATDPRSMTPLLAVLTLWPLAWAAGLVARSLLYERPLVSAFSFVSLIVPAALLAAWRWAYQALQDSRARRRAVRAGAASV